MHASRLERHRNENGSVEFEPARAAEHLVGFDVVGRQTPRQVLTESCVSWDSNQS